MESRRLWKRLLPTLLLVCTFGSGVAAQPPERALTVEKEIVVDAKSISYDQQLGAMIATGDVVIRRGDVELRADEVRVNQETQEADAIGNVSLMDPEGIMFADRMHLNLKSETGELSHATLHARRGGFSLSGERIEKGIGQSYHIENGKFTTCDCESGPPSWSIGADELDLALEGYAELEGARFNILDVPVFYLPRAVLPVNRERQSGLLVPRVGLSNRRGLQVFQPIYWSINKSEDATLGIDVETSARFGLVGEYRYAVSRLFEGTIGASYFNEAIRGSARESSKGEDSNPHVPENRWNILSEHTQHLGSAEAYADLFIVGDDLFLREINTFAMDYNTDIDLRTRPFTESRTGLIQRWDRIALLAEGVFYQDLVENDDLVLQRAPEIRVLGQKNLGWGLLSEVRGSVTDFVRQEGVDGVRVDLEPGLRMHLPLGKLVYGSLYATLRETVYQLNENEMSGGFRGDDDSPDAEEVRLPNFKSRETVELGGEISTALNRVFGFGHFGLDKLKHTIAPTLRYLYIPGVSQDDVMVFDNLDRIEQRSLLTYGFSSRLMARRAPRDEESQGEVVELTRFSVSQSYDFSRALPSSTSAAASDSDHLSDIDFSLRINPSRRTSVRAASSYDPETTSFSSATVGVRIVEPFVRAASSSARVLNKTSLSVAYRFVTDDPLRNAVRSLESEDTDVLSAGIEQVDSDLTLRVTERIGLRYATRFNVRENSFLENYFGIRLISACNCWSLDVGIRDTSNPDEIGLQAQFRFVGLGDTSPDLPFRMD